VLLKLSRDPGTSLELAGRQTWLKLQLIKPSVNASKIDHHHGFRNALECITFLKCISFMDLVETAEFL
jgi:hypothetical protein